MGHKEFNRGEGSLHRKYIDWRGSETIRNPALDSVPEDIQFLDHSLVRDKEVGPIGHDGKQEGSGKSVCPERREACPRGHLTCTLNPTIYI